MSECFFIFLSIVGRAAHLCVGGWDEFRLSTDEKRGCGRDFLRKFPRKHCKWRENPKNLLKNSNFRQNPAHPTVNANKFSNIALSLFNLQSGVLLC